MTKDKLRAGIDVAFNNNVTKLAKVSYNRTLDIQYGIYCAEPFKGCLTVNCKPTDDKIDWLIDFWALPYKTMFGKVHRGYQKEIMRYLPQIRDTVIEIIREHKCTGIIVSGRSKGAGEALLLVPYLSDMLPVLLCGAVEPPKVCDSRYAEYLNTFGTDIFITSYKNDIVTGIPPWFDHPVLPIQNGKRRLGLSIKDHIKSTTEEELWYEYIDKL